MAIHSSLKEADGIHQAFAKTFANEAARLAFAGVTADDIGKIARQDDTPSYWILIDDSPVTWLPIDVEKVSDRGNGDARGANATDFQDARTLSTEVASGDRSGLVSGKDNTVDGEEAFVGAGRDNEATGDKSGVVGGNANRALGLEGFIGGGSGNVIQSGVFRGAIPGGLANNVDAEFGYAIGSNADAKRIGQFSHAAFAGGQMGQINWKILTNDASFTEMSFDGAAPSGSAVATATRFVLENDSSYTFDILVVARRTDVDGESAGYRLEFVIDRNATAGSTALVGAVTKTVIGEDTAAWDVQVTADTVNGSVKLEVKGDGVKNLTWIATGRFARVTG